MTGRNKEELNGVTLLGNQKNKYPTDYAPEMLESFISFPRLISIRMLPLVKAITDAP